MPIPITRGNGAAAGYGFSSGVANITANYLVVAGGGGGGGGSGGDNYGAGGGGAGGLLTGTITISAGSTYTVTVGSGGPAGASSKPYTGGSGSNSTIGSLVNGTIGAIGGGGGGESLSGSNSPATSGGSGGGSSAAQSPGSGTVGQGNNGGASSSTTPNYGGGGGGGAGAVGSAGTTTSGGNGGAGSSSSISGSSIVYAGGGGGGVYVGGTVGTGGSGGGGNGGTVSLGYGYPGTQNLGGGGGGASFAAGAATLGGAGGAGVVIISYAGAQQFGGGIVTSVGGNTIHTFNTSGTLTPLSSLTASYLIVAGGGGGGSYGAGGGGAGGMLTGTGLIIDTNSNYSVVVGAGGIGSTISSVAGTNGGNSSVGIVSTTAVGGGGGGSYTLAVRPGANGGSGGGGSGGSSSTANGGNPTSGQGYAGGIGYPGGNEAGGGGGGAGGPGSNGVTCAHAGAGGVGLTSTILPYPNAQSLSVGQVVSTSVYFAGGGGGGYVGNGSSAAGGYGGGGNGGYYTGDTGLTAGSSNTGGGGGGGSYTSSPGANGGSGVVIISYPGSVQQMAGGQIVIAGGNVIHIFTSTGFLTPLKFSSGSLRFRSTATTYLSRTFVSTPTSWTASFWVKRGQLGANQAIFGSRLAGTGSALLQFNSNDTLGVANNATSVATNAIYRDTSAWYHFVVSWSSSNVVVVYCNGVTQSLTGSISGANQLFTSSWTNTIGRDGDSASMYFDGELTEVNFIDGQVLTPTNFGAYNSYGQWQPITYSGSYGTNGFYLPFNKGSPNYAGYFNGSNQSLTIANNSAFNLTTGNWTIEGWFNTSTPGASAATNTLFCVGNPIQIYAQSNTVAMYVSSTNGGAYFINPASGPANSVIANVWNHFACVKNGNNYTTYVNGIAGVTVTSATAPAVSTGANGIGYYPPSNNVFFSGFISNIRVVNGTAVYNSNFIPQTTPLTAISNTVLLTLQNSTIVDNSANAFSITNNGSTTISQQYPFSTGVFNDQGPAGNNWTPNNISVGTTSTATAYTLDLMNDTPTLTNSTASNYCVFNPNATSSVFTYTNGNLSVACNGSAGSAAIGSMSVNSGKWYWEMTLTATYAYAGAATMESRSSVSYLGQVSGQFIYNVGIPSSSYIDGTIYNYSTASACNVGDVIGVALDFTANTVTFYRNGTSQGIFGSNFISGRAWTPAFQVNGASSATFNFGQQPFQYTPPSGYLALNTYNLPAPTIPNGRLYMDATTYTGNGASTASIYNAATFQPDFIWIKNRSSAYGPLLYNSIVGAGTGSTNTALSSAGNGSESGGNAGSTYGYLSSFNSNGFTATKGSDATSYTNGSGQTYVAWQWQAGAGTTSTNTAGTITSTVSANTSSGFSIVAYNGNGTTNTVGHGLGLTPAFIIAKTRSTTGDWLVYHQSLGSNYYLYLDNTTAISSSTPGYWGTPSTTTFGVLGGGYGNNISGATMIAYVWAPIPGFSAFGSYTGNGSATGPFVYTGFRPKFLMIKRTDAISSWSMIDSSRTQYNPVGEFINADTTGAGSVYSGLNFLSNGFANIWSDVSTNASGGTYIYMAFAENPFKYSNAR